MLYEFEEKKTTTIENTIMNKSIFNKAENFFQVKKKI